MNAITVGDSLKNNDCTFEMRERDIKALEKAEAEARKRERHSPYKKFAQVNLSSECCEARRALMLKYPKSAVLFEFLLEHADGYNAVICSEQVLGEVLKSGRTTVYKAIKILKDSKFIDIKKSGSSNVYLLNKELVWKSWGTNCKYAEFGAKVIISESEQEENVKVKTKRTNLIDLVDTGHNDEYNNDN